MARGFMGVKGATALGCGEWSMPAETSRMSPGRMPARPLTLSRAVPPMQAPAPRLEPTELAGRQISCATCEAKKKLIEEERRRRGMAGRNRPGAVIGRDLPACGLDGAAPARVAASLGQTCPLTPVPDGMSCQKTAAGDIICSNGVTYSGTCQNSPKVTVEGVAPAGATAPQAPVSGAVTPAVPAAASSIPPLAIGAAILGGVGLLILIFK